MATDRTASLAVPAAAALLLWPALWNGFPIVFADTGTYLSQAIHHYAGWDRPVFYSLFMLPLHLRLTLWPVIVTQALLAAWVIRLVIRVLIPRVSGTACLAGAAVLSACTWLPWLVSELMPDLFTPLLVLVLCLLAWVPERLSPWEQTSLVGLAALMTASQQSSLPVACLLGLVLALLRRWVGPCAALPAFPDRRVRPATVITRPLGTCCLVVLPPLLAVLGLCTVNLAAYGRFAVSPFGNVFLLARVIYDGPGMAVLQRDCPVTHWRLCPFLDSLPASSDDFLWTADSPLRRAGGPKAVSPDAAAIIEAALLADPAGEARAALANTWEQLTRFNSGDGLTPWPDEVTPWIERDFPPREQAAYASARQQAGSLAVPPFLARIHTITGLAGIVACAVLLPVALRRRAVSAGFLLAVLLILPFGAAITGGLSAPHDRYQARIMWLPPFVAVAALLSLRRFPVNQTPGIGAPRSSAATFKPPA